MTETISAILADGFNDRAAEVVDGSHQRFAKELARRAVEKSQAEAEISRTEIENLLRSAGILEEEVSRYAMEILSEWEHERLIIYRGDHWAVRDPSRVEDRDPEWLARHPFEQ